MTPGNNTLGPAGATRGCAAAASVGADKTSSAGDSDIKGSTGVSASPARSNAQVAGGGTPQASISSTQVAGSSTPLAATSATQMAGSGTPQAGASSTSSTDIAALEEAAARGLPAAVMSPSDGSKVQ